MPSWTRRTSAEPALAGPDHSHQTSRSTCGREVPTRAARAVHQDPRLDTGSEDGAAGLRPCATSLVAGYWGFLPRSGNMRMDGPKGKGVVDHNLKVHGFDNLFCCDLSVYPVSPPANPTRTLTAISLRLAKHLASKTPRKGHHHHRHHNGL